MNYAIIYIRNDEEKQLSKAPYLGGNLLLYTVREIRKIESIDEIYIVGYDAVVPGCINKADLEEAIVSINDAGKTLLLSPLYPDLNADDYKKLLSKDVDGAVISYEDEPCEAFMINNSKLKKLDSIDYLPVEIKHKTIKKITKE